MKFTPREYQTLARDFILDTPRGSLWAGMGMGKTVSSLTAYDALEYMGEVRRLLVLAPKRVAKNVWPREAKKWDHLQHLDVAPITGTAKQRLAALQRDAHVHTINYDNLQWLIEQTGRRSWRWDMVVADESTRLKGHRLRHGSKRAAALARVSHLTERWVNLTGTPAPNGLIDLWGQNWFVDRGRRLGSTFTAFQERWFAPSPDGYGVVPRPFAGEQLHAQLRDVCLTLRPEDWFDLEEPVVVNVPVELPPKAMRLYREMETRMFIEMEREDVDEEAEIEAFNAAAKTGKCAQLANGAIYTDDAGNWEEVHRAKLDALQSVINEAAGMPVLVAYWFRHDLARLLKAFPQGRVLDDKAETEDAWNRGGIPLLFAHPQSAGHGLSLQDGGNIVCFYSMTWNLELYLQILERIGPVRQAQAGHDRPVFIYHLLAEDTIDYLMLERQQTKKSVQDILMNAMIRRMAA